MPELVDIITPEQQDGTMSVIASWLVKQGDYVAIEDPILELETDKVALEVPSPASGVVTEIIVEAGQDASPGLLLGRIDVSALSTDKTVISDERPTAHAHLKNYERNSDVPLTERRYSPSVRRILAEAELTGDGISGTGRNGRITKSDALAYVASYKDPISTREERGISSSASMDSTFSCNETTIFNKTATARSATIPHSPMRRAIAKHTSGSVSAAPHVTSIFEADFSNIIAHRIANNESFIKAGAPLTYTAYIVSAAVEAMKVAPAINSQWHDDFVEIFKDVNIGVGTALGDDGLVVPVIHHAQALSLEGIAKRLQDITFRARENKLRSDDMKNGTFSISNHGTSGSLMATPIIINQPQSAILGIGKIEKRVCVLNSNGTDAIQIKPKAFVSLTIDHRVIDGYQTNVWLSRFVEVIETWPNT